MKQSRVAKFLSNSWFDKIDSQEIEQEELIQKWEHPALEGYEGLLAFNSLLYREYNQSRNSVKTVRLKKNTPGVIPHDVSFDDLLINVLTEFTSRRGLISLLAQPWIQSVYYGKNIDSIRDFAKHLGIPKSTLHLLLQ